MPGCMKEDVPHSDSQIPPPLFVISRDLPNPKLFLHSSMSYIVTDVCMLWSLVCSSSVYIGYGDFITNC